jgi:hypothetical protein
MTNQTLGPLQQKWVNYLKRNGHKQGEGSLGYVDREGQKKMCCLGAAGYAILKTCHWHKGSLCDDTKEDLDDYSPSGYLSFSYTKLGLYSEAGEIKGDKHWEDPNTLAGLNDDNVSWYEIACYIEAAPELFFSKAV